MKAFWISVAAVVVITVGAAVVLSNVDMSAKQVYSSTRGDVRL
jgi:uncharacterized membrane protein